MHPDRRSRCRCCCTCSCYCSFFLRLPVETLLHQRAKAPVIPVVLRNQEHRLGFADHVRRDTGMPADLTNYGFGHTGHRCQPFAEADPLGLVRPIQRLQDTGQTKGLLPRAGVELEQGTGILAPPVIPVATNTNPMSPHNLIASLPGSFDGSTHNPDQPLNQAIVTGRDKLFASTPLLLWQPRTAISWQFAPNTVLRSGFGVFSDLLPGSIVDSIAANPPYINTFQGGLLGQAGGLAIAPGVPDSAVDATVAANQAFLNGFQRGAPSCAAASANPKTCLPPVALTAIPDGRLRAPYFLQWSFAIERQLGNTGSRLAQSALLLSV